MEENKVTKEKFTYDELNNIATQLSKQNEQLYNQLQQANLANSFTRLEFLFQVVKYSDKFPSDFVNNAVNEIVNMMTISDNPNVKTNTQENAG